MPTRRIIRIMIIGLFLIKLFFVSSQAANFLSYPDNPSTFGGTGTGLFVNNVPPGTYTVQISIFDALGSTLHRDYYINNYVITNPDLSVSHVLQTWDFYDDVHNYVGAGTYLAALKMTNVNTGSVISLTTKIGLSVRQGSEPWMATYNVSKIIDQFGDKIYRFPIKGTVAKYIFNIW